MSTKKKSLSRAVQQKIRIRLKSFDYRLLDQSTVKIVNTAQKSGARVLGPIPLPVQKKVWCVLKSPHVNKRGGEHYEIRIHKRLIEIVDPPSTAVDALMTIDLPSGVDIEIKLLWEVIVSNKNKILVGKKLGMTQIIDESGKVIPITVVQALKMDS